MVNRANPVKAAPAGLIGNPEVSSEVNCSLPCRRSERESRS